ncbi:MAG: tetratricopeptide repeat protein [Rhodoferax sp.]
MKKLFDRLFSGKKSNSRLVAPTPISKPDRSTESVAHRRRGNEFLDRGDLQSAIDCYRQAVASDSDSVDALTSLGFALKEAGDLAAAQAALQKAAQLKPDSFDPAYLLGQTCSGLRQFEKAAQHFEKALALQPAFEPLYGELCHALFQIKAMGRARDLIRKGIERHPENAAFHLFLGNLYSFMEEWPNAAASYATALKLNPNFAQAHANLASVFRAQGDLDSAVHHAQCALKADPASPDTHACVAANQEAQGRLEDALSSYEKALGHDPVHAASHRGKGNALLKLGQLDAAIASFTTALSIDPDSAETYRDLGVVFLELGRHREAEENSRKALSLRPLYPSAQNNLGMALMSLGRLQEAEKYYRAALSIDPDSDVYLSNLGGTQLAQGRLVEAARSFRRAIEINPQFLSAHGNLLYTLSVDPTVSKDQYLSEALVFGSRLAASVGEPYKDWLVSRDAQAISPLRIGLISGRFCNNPVGFFLESVLANIDSTEVEIVAYATSVREDELTLRIRPYFSQWVNIYGMERGRVAEKIRADRIHILVDLNGHTEGNLLPVFALKPAPVQVSWLGYWASAGVQGVDYILADETCLPPSEKPYFTEIVHYLPLTRLCFTAPAYEVPVAALPALRNGFVTFGCFQTLTKINDGVMKLWSGILKAVPKSRLRLAVSQFNEAAFQQKFLQRLHEAGIDVARVTLVGQMPREKYLDSYNQIDMVLDTFPYAGGTTTCEALWMGVPTLTLNGETMIARQGAGMLTCVGLDDWIAGDEEDYLAKAISHAADLAGLANLRNILRDRALASALFDAPRFARNLEHAFRAMWQHQLNLANELPQFRGTSSVDSPKPA